jgi:hypothetical protein
MGRRAAICRAAAGPSRGMSRSISRRSSGETLSAAPYTVRATWHRHHTTALWRTP